METLSTQEASELYLSKNLLTRRVEVAERIAQMDLTGVKVKTRGFDLLGGRRRLVAAAEAREAVDAITSIGLLGRSFDGLLYAVTDHAYITVNEGELS